MIRALFVQRLRRSWPPCLEIRNDSRMGASCLFGPYPVLGGEARALAGTTAAVGVALRTRREPSAQSSEVA